MLRLVFILHLLHHHDHHRLSSPHPGSAYILQLCHQAPYDLPLHFTTSSPFP
eukprot:c10115_g1_i1 orf=54-209(+)